VILLFPYACKKLENFQSRDVLNAIKGAFIGISSVFSGISVFTMAGCFPEAALYNKPATDDKQPAKTGEAFVQMTCAIF
jgi:hypothetical protein